ncbi:MAG: hypothetical protein Q7S46_04930 [Gallionella sp.]|nr:hypothetical protein [Gallionella sp.]
MVCLYAGIDQQQGGDEGCEAEGFALRADTLSPSPSPACGRGEFS